MPRRVDSAAAAILPIPNIECMGCCGDIAVVGNDAGELYAFLMHTTEPTVLAHTQAHEGAITALLVYRLVEPTSDEYVQLVSTQRDALASNVLVSHLSFVRVITASSDGALSEWRLMREEAKSPFEFRLMNQFRLHNESITALAIDPVGKVFSSSLDRTARSWEFSLGNCRLFQEFDVAVTTITCWEGCTKAMVVCGLESGDVALCRAKGGGRRKTMSGHTQRVNSVVVLPTDQLASGSEDGSVRMWDPVAVNCVNILWASHGPVTTLCATGVGSIVMVGFANGDMTRQNLDSSIGALQVYEGHRPGALVHTILTTLHRGTTVMLTAARDNTGAVGAKQRLRERMRASQGRMTCTMTHAAEHTATSVLEWSEMGANEFGPGAGSQWRLSKCPHQGCGRRRALCKVESHATACLWCPVRCGHPDCDMLLPSKDLKEHMGLCAHRPATCYNRGCEEQFLAGDRADHDLVCAFKEVQCEYVHDYGTVQLGIKEGQTADKDDVAMVESLEDHAAKLSKLVLKLMTQTEIPLLLPTEERDKYMKEQVSDLVVFSEYLEDWGVAEHHNHCDLWLQQVLLEEHLRKSHHMWKCKCGQLLTAAEAVEHDLYDCDEAMTPTLEAAHRHWLNVEAKKTMRLWHKRYCRYPQPWWIEYNRWTYWFVDPPKKKKKKKGKKKASLKVKKGEVQDSMKRRWMKWKPHGVTNWRVYLKECDKMMLLPEFRQKRQALFRHPMVQAGLNAFWVAVQRMADPSEGDVLSKDKYMHEYLKLAECIAPGIEHEEAMECFTEDWLTDSARGSETISKESFGKALFELADMWCMSVDPAEYSDFLDMLAQWNGEEYLVAEREAEAARLREESERADWLRRREQELLDAERRRQEDEERELLDAEAAEEHREFERRKSVSKGLSVAENLLKFVSMKRALGSFSDAKKEADEEEKLRLARLGVIMNDWIEHIRHESTGGKVQMWLLNMKQEEERKEEEEREQMKREEDYQRAVEDSAKALADAKKKRTEECFALIARRLTLVKLAEVAGAFENMSDKWREEKRYREELEARRLGICHNFHALWATAKAMFHKAMMMRLIAYWLEGMKSWLEQERQKKVAALKEKVDAICEAYRLRNEADRAADDGSTEAAARELEGYSKALDQLGDQEAAEHAANEARKMWQDIERRKMKDDTAKGNEREAQLLKGRKVQERKKYDEAAILQARARADLKRAEEAAMKRYQNQLRYDIAAATRAKQRRKEAEKRALSQLWTKEQETRVTNLFKFAALERRRKAEENAKKQHDRMIRIYHGTQTHFSAEPECDKGKRSLHGGIYSIPESCYDAILHPISPSTLTRMATGQDDMQEQRIMSEHSRLRRDTDQRALWDLTPIHDLSAAECPSPKQFRDPVVQWSGAVEPRSLRNNSPTAGLLLEHGGSPYLQVGDSGSLGAPLVENGPAVEPPFTWQGVHLWGGEESAKIRADCAELKGGRKVLNGVESRIAALHERSEQTEQWAGDSSGQKVQETSTAVAEPEDPEAVSPAAVEWMTSFVLPLAEQLEKELAKGNTQVTLEELAAGTPFEWFMAWAEGADKKIDLLEGNQMRQAVFEYLSGDRDEVTEQIEGRHSPKPVAQARPSTSDCNQRVGRHYNKTRNSGSLQEHCLSQTIRAPAQMSESPALLPVDLSVSAWATDMTLSPESPQMASPAAELSPVVFQGPYHGPGKWSLPARIRHHEIESHKLRKRATSVLASTVQDQDETLSPAARMQRYMDQTRPATAPADSSAWTDRVDRRPSESSALTEFSHPWPSELGSLGCELTVVRKPIVSTKLQATEMQATELTVPAVWPPPVAEHAKRSNIPNKLLQLNGTLSPNTPPRKSRLIPGGPAGLQRVHSNLRQTEEMKKQEHEITKQREATAATLSNPIKPRTTLRGKSLMHEPCKRPATSLGLLKRRSGLSPSCQHPAAKLAAQMGGGAENGVTQFRIKHKLQVRPGQTPPGLRSPQRQPPLLNRPHSTPPGSSTGPLQHKPSSAWIREPHKDFSTPGMVAFKPNGKKMAINNKQSGHAFPTSSPN